MDKKLKSILLLDDNLSTNFFHKKIIEKSNVADLVLEFRSGTNALKYLSQEGIEQPELILVDINMPVMNAWVFLDKFSKLKNDSKIKTTIILLSTSLSPADKERADAIPLIEHVLLKPLTKESILKVIENIIEKKTDERSIKI
ncbi:response regulator [Zobellia roscoffensis]|uniref:response regulator n=1 Tax=Zobellia roscoffensis TaxID=2779508 RepID=UPI00188B1D3D|nr:response regulator [Zobellia roscoffensis]